MKSTKALIGVLVLLCLAFCCLGQTQPPLSTFLTPSTCEYTYAAYVDNPHISEFRERQCNRLTTPEACDKQGYCWWRNTTNQNALASHQYKFNTPTVYTPAPGVYVAVGYDLANSILIVNNGQSVLIDTLGSSAAASSAVAAFEAALGGPIPPVAAVIYTHSHPDHIGGTPAFNIPPGTKVYAQATFLVNLQKTLATAQILTARSGKQFGFPLYEANYGLDTNGYLGDGIGPFTTFDSVPRVLPNTFFATELNVTLAGLDFRLISTPGETDDTIAIYIASLRTVFVGDNIYAAFPNLYAIRGTPPRDVKLWYQSVDKVRALNPAIVIGSHTPPFTTNIASMLTNYRDAIQFVNDQTVALLNQGLHPNDIANTIKLPEHLASDPNLQQFYGYVPFCVRSVFTSYLGWFSGDIAELNALPTTVQAKRLVDLAGGSKRAIVVATEALNEAGTEGTQWALQILTALLKVVPTTSEDFQNVYDLYIQAASQIGYAQPATTGRNFYLSTVELFVAAHAPAGQATTRSVHAMNINVEAAKAYFNAPLSVFMETLGSMINTKKTEEITFTVQVSFLPSVEESLYISDVQDYHIDIRRQVTEVYPSALSLALSPKNADLVLQFDSPATFKSLILSLSNVKDAIESKSLVSDYSQETIEYFFDLFKM